MSIASEIQRLRDVRSRILQAIRDKGGTAQEGQKLADVPGLIAQIPGRKEPCVEFTPGEDGFVRELTFHGEETPQSLGATVIGFLEKLTVAEGTRRIGAYAFSGCEALKEVSLPESLAEIQLGGFSECGALTTMELPKHLEVIGEEAFRYDTALVLTTIPASVKTIGSTAFSRCYGIRDLTFLGTPEEIAGDAFQGCGQPMTIRVPWGEDEDHGQPWGATKATMVYNVGAEG